MTSLVKRKIGGLVGVVMNQTPDEVSQSGFICEVAFGYMSKSDANQNKKFGEVWPEVHSDHLKAINDTFL
jgi:hypothetical protein